MNISKITTTAAQHGNKLATKLGSGIEKAPKLQKFIKNFEPIGGDNSFFGLASIMLGAVLIPRIITAAKRNPDNKEATKDEITEILFRDVQTILIMLFGLKILNSGIGNLATKLSGIPMVNKPFKEMFKSTEKGLKGLKEKASEFFQEPIKKGKIALQNLGMLINPIEGSRLATGNEINSRFAVQESISEVKKFLEDVPNHGGDSEKVYKKIINSLIKGQDKAIADKTALALAEGETPNIEKLTEIKQELQKMLEGGYEKFKAGEVGSKSTDELMVKFFDNPNNDLARSARNVKDWLRMLALGIEVTYLGFGLPALNQKRLEKKYLSEKPIGEKRGDSFTPINDKHIKPQEIKLYSNFIK